MIESNVFNINKKEGVTYLTFKRFEELSFLKHLFSTRHGGVSEGQYESMNLSFDNGDVKAHVEENFRRICQCIDVKLNHLVLSKQVHKDDIHIVTQADRGNGILKPNVFGGADGLVTDEKEVALVTTYADCVPLYFIDANKEVIASVHAGWRGTLKGIGKKAVELMINQYESNIEDILVGIGPSIGPCCFEVSDDVKNELEKCFNSDIIDKLIRPKDNGRYLLDLWQTNQQILLEAGIKEENIVVTDICTMCHKADLHSHRGTNGKRGNLVAIMELV